jgi:hypothetical protein
VVANFGQRGNATAGNYGSSSLISQCPRRESVLELLMSWKVSLEVAGQFQREKQSLMVELSQAYLEWKQQTEQRGVERGAIQEARSLVLRLLTRRVGELPEFVRPQIETLSLAQLEALGEALLDFANLSDLEAWLVRQE